MFTYDNDCPQLIKEFLNFKATNNISSETIKQYHSDLLLFAKYFSKNNDIKKFTIETIKSISLNDLYDYMYHRMSQHKNKPSTRARKVASLRSFYRYLNVKAKLLSENITLELEIPKIDKRLPRYLNVEESKNLLQNINGDYEIRDYCIITLFLNCGIRLSELVNIDLEDIKDNKLKIFGKGSKERDILLNDACIDALHNYYRIRPSNVIDKEALFISKQKKRINISTVEKLVKKYIKAAGLNSKKYSVHKLRHTAATLMYRYGNNDIRTLQKILGHESILTTEKYTHVSNEQVENLVRANPLSNIKRLN